MTVAKILTNDESDTQPRIIKPVKAKFSARQIIQRFLTLPRLVWFIGFLLCFASSRDTLPLNYKKKPLSIGKTYKLWILDGNFQFETLAHTQANEWKCDFLPSDKQIINEKLENLKKIYPDIPNLPSFQSTSSFLTLTSEMLFENERLSNELLVYENPAKGSKERRVPKGNQVIVLFGIFLAAILMIEGIAPELSFFLVIFIWFPATFIYVSYGASRVLGQGDIAILPVNTGGNTKVRDSISQGIFDGFTEKSTLEMAAYFIIAEALKESGVLEKGIKLFIGRPNSLMQIILRLFIPAMLISSICSNSAVVAMCVPIVYSIVELVGKWPATVLMGPLAFAATMGGSITVLGSPTNGQGRDILQKPQCTEVMEAYFRAKNKSVNREMITSVHCMLGTIDTPFVLHGIICCTAGIFTSWIGMTFYSWYIGISDMPEIAIKSEDSKLELTNTEPSAGENLVEVKGEPIIEISNKCNVEDSLVVRSEDNLNDNGEEDDVIVPIVLEKLDRENDIKPARPVRYEIKMTVEDAYNPDFVDCKLRYSLPYVMKKMNLTKYNGESIDRSFESEQNDDRILAVDDILTIENDAATFVKLRAQFLSGVLRPSTPLYSGLGRNRKGRLLYQVHVSTPKEIDLLMQSEKGQFDFFSETGGVIIGYDKHFSMLLVEAGSDTFPGKVDKLEFVNCPLVTAVPGSRTPRTDNNMDTIKGFVILAVFLSSIVFQAIEEYNASKNVGGNKKAVDKYRFTTILFYIGLLSVFLRLLTWKMMIGAIHPGPVLTFAAAAIVKEVIQESKTGELLGSWLTFICGKENPLLLIFVGYAFIALSTNFISNPGCVSIFTPVMIEAGSMQTNPLPCKPLVILVIAGAVANYMTPVGCGHNMLSYGAVSNYTFKDYALFGWPTQIGLMVTSCMFTYFYCLSYDSMY